MARAQPYSDASATTQEIAHMRNIPYQEAVGSLMYASLGTCPDITYAVQTVSRFSKNPGQAHWEAVKRIFRYLKGTKEFWLTYGGQQKELRGFADADGSMAEDRHAISGYAFLLHGGAVSWAAKRQEIVSLSTTESEYVAVTHASKEALWLRSLISQLFDIVLAPTPLFSDNQSAIALTKDHQYHLVFDTGNPWVDLRSSVPVPVYIHTPVSRIRIQTGLGWGTDTGM